MSARQDILDRDAELIAELRSRQGLYADKIQVSAADHWALAAADLIEAQAIEIARLTEIVGADIQTCEKGHYFSKYRDFHCPRCAVLPHVKAADERAQAAESKLSALTNELAGEREKFTMHTAHVHAWLSALADKFSVGSGEVADVCSQILDRASALTERCEALEKESWQPIEGAPRDGTMVDLWCVDPQTDEYGNESEFTCHLSHCSWIKADQTPHGIESWARITDDGDWDFVQYAPTSVLGLPPWVPTHFRIISAPAEDKSDE